MYAGSNVQAPFAAQYDQAVPNPAAAELKN